MLHKVVSLFGHGRWLEKSSLSSAPVKSITNVYRDIKLWAEYSQENVSKLDKAQRLGKVKKKTSNLPWKSKKKRQTFRQTFHFTEGLTLCLRILRLIIPSSL